MLLTLAQSPDLRFKKMHIVLQVKNTEVEAYMNDNINPSTYIIKAFRLDQVEVSEALEQWTVYLCW